MTYKQRILIQKSYENKWRAFFPELDNSSGIYVLTRNDGNFKYAYIGQAKQVLKRLGEHMMGYQHIDLSLKKHKLYDPQNNPTGWKVVVYNCLEEELNELEQYYIKQYADLGYQLRNKTSGSQSVGKTALDVDQREPKGYREGLQQGEKKARKIISLMFDKYLDVVIKQPTSKIKEKQLQKFKDYIKGE